MQPTAIHTPSILTAIHICRQARIIQASFCVSYYSKLAMYSKQSMLTDNIHQNSIVLLLCSLGGCVCRGICDANLVVINERDLHQVLQTLQQRPPALLRAFQDRDVSLQGRGSAVEYGPGFAGRQSTL